MQRTAADRLTRSKQEAPHIYLTRAVDVTELLALRATLNDTLVAAGGSKVSVNDLVVKAVATALRAHPEVNVSFAGDSVRRHKRVHVGVAVAVASGLLVPVVRDADRASVSEIAARTRDLSARARDRKLRPEEMTGGTFTVSNLGMYGIEQFTAVINPPEAAILAVGAAIEELRPRDGVPVVRSIMRVTLSCDHRVVDGATGAGFLQTLAGLLEAPLRILA
jgi:pyruvate dehydrogenase E2 component (dihydrolipoamide acetyltransferase)